MSVFDEVSEISGWNKMIRFTKEISTSSNTRLFPNFIRRRKTQSEHYLDDHAIATRCTFAALKMVYFVL